MHATLLFTVLFLVIVNTCTSLRLRTNFKKCDKRKANFNECLSGAIWNAITQLDKPMEKYGLPILEPFEIKSLEAKSDSQVISFQFRVKNIKVYGQTNITSLKANMNFDNNILSLAVTNPLVRYRMDYDADGKVFLVALKSSGPAECDARNLTQTFTFTLEEYNKKSKKYFGVVDTKLKIEVDDLKFHFEDLVDDENLNRLLDKLMSDNWRPVLADLSDVYLDSYGAVYGMVFHNFLKRVSVKELFDGI